MCLFFCSSSSSSSKEPSYNLKINSITGEEIHLSDFKGKFILFVNVASYCGFTKQYVELVELRQKYSDTLVVIGVPYNQFGSQEPGTEEEISQFCDENYGVSFLLTKKVDVKGKNRHPLYSWLCSKELNGKTNTTVEWNFQKYLVGKNGEFIDYFYSTTNPLSEKILKIIND